jgi:membrane associated rhomboid family serine protease/antitoxin component YwqK of YwqJK toxin-antitoxin module
MKNPRVTLLLIVANVLVFAGMALFQQNLWFNRNQDFYFMLATGANFNPYTVGGEYWRLFTSMFMHWGVVHLAVNMYVLYGIGRVLESFLGSLRFFIFYLITGFTAGLASLYFNVYVVSAGASGAIFGLYGYLIMQQILANFRNLKVLRGIAVNFVLFVVVNYAIARQLSVDNAAHIGGFVSGVMLCLLNYWGWLVPLWQQALVAVVLPFAVFFVPKGQLRYYETFNLVAVAEARLVDVYDQLLTDDQRADSLRNEVKPKFDSALIGLSNLGTVPARIASDTTLLREYIELRRKEIDYRLLGIEKETYIYVDSLDEIAATIRSLPSFRYKIGFEARRTYLDSSDESEVSLAEIPEIKVYYDSNWRELPDSAGAYFYRIGRRDSLDRWQGAVYDYYLNGAIQMKGSYSDNMHHGIFRYYRRNGTYESLGRYENDRPVGKWESYYANGQLESEVYYGNGAFTRTVYDSLGNPQVTNGNGRQVTWHENGTIEEEGGYVDGRKEGTWYGYYPSGKGHYQEFYREGLLVRGVALDEEGARYVYDQLSIFPFPEMGMPDYERYLETNVRRPEGPGRHRGTVELTFLVHTDGSLADFVVVSSLCPACDREAIRLVKEGPPWRPGVSRGHIKSPAHGYVTVRF